MEVAQCWKSTAGFRFLATGIGSGAFWVMYAAARGIVFLTQVLESGGDRTHYIANWHPVSDPRARAGGPHEQM